MEKGVCHVSTVHPVWDTRIFHRECRSLAEAGFKVRLLVVDQEDRFESGVQVKSVQGQYRSRFWRILKAPFRLLKVIRGMEDIEIVHLHDPELLLIARRLKNIGFKVIYDSHEDHPRHLFEKAYFPGFLKRPLSFLLEKYENRVVRSLDAVVAPTPLIRDRFAKIHTGTVEVRNTPDLQEIPYYPPSKKNGKEICYVGKITPQRGVRSLVQAMGRLEGVRLNLVGPVNEPFRSQLQEMEGWEKVVEYGKQEREGVRDVLARSTAGMVVLQPYVNFYAALPVKMFEYMAAGLPVLSSDFDLWKDIVTSNDCGICVDPTDPERIAEGIKALLSDPERMEEMGRNGRNAAEREYNWEKDAERLRALYRDLV